MKLPEFEENEKAPPPCVADVLVNVKLEAENVLPGKVPLSMSTTPPLFALAPAQEILDSLIIIPTV
jgi:hypothetical protein